ncbi:unnamed protein product [Meloidogyne enterolobii]|uniref:Uncharacterized protein n=1 Tax=Meloidogyne enterolobii TaxID=390850 RepID=A0ACB1A8J4_MELEN
MLQNSQQDIDAPSNPGMNQQLPQSTNPQRQQPPFPQHQQQHHFPAPDCTIWMGDLNPDWDASYIREAFGQYGKDIVNVKMVTTDQGARLLTVLLSFPMKILLVMLFWMLMGNRFQMTRLEEHVLILHLPTLHIKCIFF